MRTRLRAHAGLWTLVGLLGVAIVFTATSVGPTTTRVQDAGLRQMVDAAPYTTRDLISTRPAGSATEANSMRRTLQRNLSRELTRVVESAWEYHFTQVVPGEGWGATLVGDGVATSDFGLAPVVTLHHQVELDEQLSVTDGRAPANDPESDLVEVMVEESVAGALGLEAGQDYRLYPGLLGLMRHPGTGDWVTAGPLASLDDEPHLTVRVTGVFVADDPADPVWDHGLLLDHRFVTIPIPIDPPHPPAPRGGLVTDEAGFATLLAHERSRSLAPQAGVRLRLDTSRLDTAWAGRAGEAVARAETDPALRSVPLSTRLPDLLAEFESGAAATRAVIAVAAAGILATLVGLLVLAARLTMDRRRAELGLLRARGGSLVVVTARVAAEALPVALLVGLVAWPLHRLATGEPVWAASTLDSVALPFGLAVLLTWLVTPVSCGLVARRSGVVAAREDLAGRPAHPARLTAELVVVVLAGIGFLLVRQRGLAAEGVDPYLSAVPVLLALAAGLLALRLYPWPVRALAALARRLRGAVGFVGLARAGRAASGAGLALLVLAVAVTVGGFAGAVSAGVQDARQAGAVQSLGAHLRVAADEMPEGAVAAVQRVPGVDAVAFTARGGVAREAPVRHGQALPYRDIVGSRVVVVDVVAYQEVLAGLGVPARLPEELLSATPDAEPLPVLASPAIGDRNRPTVWIDDVEREVVAVGDVAGLPGPDRDRSWVLVPRQAWPENGPDDGTESRSVTRVTGYELLVTGPEADPEAVRAAVEELPEAGLVTVSSLTDVRQDLEQSGFNSGLTLVLVAGTVGAALGGVLAVGLALVVQARSRGRVLSLLRTMGLSSRQARGLLLVEVLPPTVLAVGVGAAAGAAMPALFGAAMGLDRFTGGVPVTFQIDPGAAAVLAGLVVALVIAGSVIEVAINRAFGLGRALRVE